MDRPARVALAGMIPLLALLGLFLADVPIGQPLFLVYRYSPLVAQRMVRAAPAVAVGAIALAILLRAYRGGGELSPRAAVGLVLCWAALTLWTFAGPPQHATQYLFNMLSPSHDGAFVLEARQVGSVREYLSEGFYERLRLSPEQMRGRRVLSNPPGVTVASILCERLVTRAVWLRAALISLFDLHEFDDPRQQTEFAAAFLLSMIFTAAWAAAVFFAYALCRTCLPQASALCVAFACVFNPAAVNFTPGKDPAQLLTVLALLCGWIKAYYSGSRWWAFASGAALALGTMVGLIHLWIGAIIAAATLWHAARRKSVKSWFASGAGPAALGFAAVAVISYAALDWSLPRTILRVALRYAEIQLPVITDPWYWTLVGLPMFLLFVGPLLWAQALACRGRADDETGLLGRNILLGTLAVMAYTYLFANNSETPRLWIPFVPLLLFGMAMRGPLFREDSPGARRALILLIGLQFGVTIAQWTLMDMRETEWRLITERMWD